MAVHLFPPDSASIFPVAGVKLGTAQAGIREAGRTDLAVIELAPGSIAAGVFTLNRYCAAPVQVCKQHLAKGQQMSALLINTGNANAGTGEPGLAAAVQSCDALGALLNVLAQQVLPFSTGVIMEELPVQRLVAGLPEAISSLREDAWIDAAKAIMTTDTVPKVASAQVEIDGETVTVTGISKGSGMIHPNMATMLGFVATDAKISAEALQQLTKEVADASFNRVTVDGDTSTNDSFIVMATGQRGSQTIDCWDTEPARKVYNAVLEVAQKLAQAIIRDGEGATKFITVQVQGGKDEEECKKAAYAIAHSPLVKTAFFASDPNLGRILAAVGYSGIDDLDQSKIELYLDDVHVVTKGGRNPQYREEDGQRVMKQDEITIRVDLGRGSASTIVWTCDLSHQYVSINADYRS